MLRSRMSRVPVSKELWKQLEPLIPAFVASRKGGRRKRTISDEAALNGILFVLQTGIAWEDLPQALGYGSGMTCWRRLRDWNAAGVWEQLHHAMLSLAAGTAGNLAKGIGAAAAEKIKDRVADTAGGRLASSLRSSSPSFEGNSLAGTAEHKGHNKSES